MRKGLVVGGALVALLACAAPARAGNANVTITQAGQSSFKVPTGVTSVQAVATGQHGGGVNGGQGARVASTLQVTPGELFSVLVASGGGVGQTAGGGLSGLIQAGTPQVIAAGGGGGAAGAGGNAGASAPGGGGAGTIAGPGQGGGGAATSGGSLTGGAGAATGGGGGAGYYGGGGGGDDAGGGGGASYPAGASVSLSSAAPSVLLSYSEDIAPLLAVEAPRSLNPATVRGTGGTDGGDTPSVTVSYFPGATATGDARATANVGFGSDGAWSSPVPELPSGTWTVEVVQTDAAQNETRVTRTFRVDTVGPEISFTAPGSFTSQSMPDFEGIAGTAEGDLPEITITITRPDGSTFAIQTSAKGSDFHETAPVDLPDGRYTAVAVQQDDLHNVGSATQVFTVDTDTPVVKLTEPAAAAELTALHVAGTAGSATGDDTHVTIEIRSGDLLVKSVDLPLTGNAYAADIPVPDGVFNVTAIQTDRAQNISADRRTVRIDSTPPNIDISGVRRSYTVGEIASPGFSCSDDGVGVAACDGSVDTSSPGTRTLTISTRDRLGNARTAQIVYAVLAPPTPQPAVRKSAASLKIKSAKLTRHGKTVTIKISGTAAKNATGKVALSVGKTKATAKLSKGKWSATLKLKTSKRKLSLKASYAGDSAFNAGSATKTVK